MERVSLHAAEAQFAISAGAAVYYEPAPDRPQPRLDRDRGRGMSAVVGRLRPCNIFHWRFTVLSHNTIRGAAGAAILNGELLKAQGYFD